MIFEPLAALWLKTRENKVSFSQYRNLRCYINHLDRYIGGMDVGQIKLTDIDALLGTLADRNPSTGHPAFRQTLVGVCSTVNHIFEYEIDLELTTRNPARGCEVSRYIPRHYRGTLTATEQGLTISTPHRARMDALVAMLTGLRRDELIPPTWDDIDLDALKISVTKSVESCSSNRLIVKSDTKTSRDRVVNITFDLVLELQEMEAVTQPKYVYPHADDKIHTPMSWRRMWDGYIKTLCKAPGTDRTSIQKIIAYYLRHTYATPLYLSGVDILTAAKLLGHSNVKITAAVYTHLDDLMLFKSVDKLDSYLSPALSRSPA